MEQKFTDNVNQVRAAMNAHGPNTIRTLAKQASGKLIGDHPNRYMEKMDFMGLYMSNGVPKMEGDAHDVMKEVLVDP